jgi:DNA-binding transcriptional ArsR family regulator
MFKALGDPTRLRIFELLRGAGTTGDVPKGHQALTRARMRGREDKAR